MKTDILQIHKNCLDFLLDWQAEHDDFYFVPRKINNKNSMVSPPQRAYERDSLRQQD